MKNEQIKDFINDLCDEEYVDLNNYVCGKKQNVDDIIYEMNEFDEIMQGDSPTTIAERIFYGDFSPNHGHFCFDGNANLQSSLWGDELGLCQSTIINFIIDKDDDCGYDEIREILDSDCDESTEE